MSSRTGTPKLLHYRSPTRARPLLAPAGGRRHRGGLEEARGAGRGCHVHHDRGQNVGWRQTRSTVHQGIEVELVHHVGGGLDWNVETAEAV